ncbi:RDD family protein [Streptomyces sp. NPDC053755]|uniref:RDD family protein n=1 Tax=Streptomyces sp. NPDC053755 TaxID=3155815 RepID=UPI00341CB7D3
MATPPGAGGEVPQAGYYPDPSIPGYIRYWNGGAWVPGTSRPAPREGEALPGPSAGTMPPGPALVPNTAPAPVPVPAVEETGPVFLDEDPVVETRPDPEPASAWHADVSRQTGFGGDRDQKVSWGAPDAESTPPAAVQDPRVSASPARLGGMPVTPASADPTGGALPGVRRPQQATDRQRPGAEGTMTIRAFPPQAQSPAPSPAQPQPTARAQAPAADRTDAPAREEQGGGAQAPQGRPGHQDAPQGPRSGTGAPVQQGPRTAPAQQSPQGPNASSAAAGPQTPAQGRLPGRSGTAPAAGSAPVTTGPGGGAPSWPQQVHQLAQPGTGGTAEAGQPVVPWKPPVEDPFLKAARAQAAARPAGLGKRLAARLVDTVVLGALTGAASFPFVVKALDHIDAKIEAAKQSGVTVQVWLLDGTTSLYFGIALAVLLVLGLLYEAVPTAKWGRTLGKKLCGLQVRDIEAHEPPTFGASLRRWLVYSLLGLLAVGVLNVLWCLFDRPWRQCWHDKTAHTFVAG